jgi:hypothetical protein
MFYVISNFLISRSPRKSAIKVGQNTETKTNLSIYLKKIAHYKCYLSNTKTNNNKEKQVITICFYAIRRLDD